LSKNPKIRTLLVGLGRIASTLENDPLRIKPCTHAGVLLSKWGKANFSLDGIYDSNPEKIELFLSQWKIETPSMVLSTSDYECLFLNQITSKRPVFDFAVVATSSFSHFEIASRLILCGVKHILIEKPVSLHSNDAKKLEKMAKQNRTKIWINHERRYHPRYQFVKEIIDSNLYGKVESVRANVFTSARNPGNAFSKYGGGPLLHDGTHAIDLLYWMFGKLKLRYANVIRPTSKAIESRATAWFTSPKANEIFLDVSGGRDYFQFEIDIFTTKGRFILSNDGFQFFHSQSSPLYKGFRSLKQFEFSKFPTAEKSSAFLGIYKEIESNIREKSDYQEGTIKDSIDILQCIESIYQYRRK